MMSWPVSYTVPSLFSQLATDVCLWVFCRRQWGFFYTVPLNSVFRLHHWGSGQSREGEDEAWRHHHLFVASEYVQQSRHSFACKRRETVWCFNEYLTYTCPSCQPRPGKSVRSRVQKIPNWVGWPSPVCHQSAESREEVSCSKRQITGWLVCWICWVQAPVWLNSTVSYKIGLNTLIW